MTHPIVQRYIDERDEVLEAVASIAADLARAARALPIECPWEAPCACTGACHPPAYYAIMRAVDALGNLGSTDAPNVVRIRRKE